MSSKILILLSLNTIYAVSSDCPNVIQFALDLGIQSKRPAIWTALQIDCCNANGVTCNVNERVDQISWPNMGLNGIINGTAIPSRVTLLFLQVNQLTGSIPTALPNGLILLSLYRNDLTGQIPSDLPNALTTLYIDGNKMSGDLPNFPSTLEKLSLGESGNPGNRFTGTLKLNRPDLLYINDNLITDVIILDSSRINPSWCDLSNNPLLGNLNIDGLTMCIKNGLYSASLLPITKNSTTLVSTTVVDTTTRTTLLASIPTSVLRMPTNSEVPASTITETAIVLVDAGSTTTEHMAKTVKSSRSSTIGTFRFVPLMNEFAFNVFMVMRLIVGAIVSTYVMTRAPFKREMKRKMNKGKKKETSSISCK